MLVNVAQQCRKVFTGILLVVGITFLVWNQALSDSKSTSRLIGQKTQTQNEENVNSSKVPTQLPWWDRKKLLDCNNSEQRRDSELMMKTDKKFSYTGFTSHCGARASSYGNGQQVITYTLFGDKDAYTVGLPSILHDASVLYKGWLVRLHTDPRTRYDLLCPLLVKYPQFSVCDALNLPPPLGDVTAADKMMWRSAPMGDQQVDRFIVRDLDSKLSEREQAAVAQWTQSGRLMHMMRDHPFHATLIMGGMFGIYQPRDKRKQFEAVRVSLFKPTKTNDQITLTSRLPSWLKKDSMQHDSYLCRHYRGSIPYPTQRNGSFFIGGRQYKAQGSYNGECPAKCRPPEHQDWLHC